MTHLARLFLIIFLAGSAFFTFFSATYSQETDKTADKTQDNRVKVTLIAAASKFELKKKNPISIVIRAENNSEEEFRIKENPLVFDIEKTGVEDNDYKFGEIYQARLTDEDLVIVKQNKRRILKPNEYVDFVVDITRLKLVPMHSSNNVWDNIFKRLAKGEYFVTAKVFLESSNGGKKVTSNFVASKIEISYADETSP